MLDEYFNFGRGSICSVIIIFITLQEMLGEATALMSAIVRCIYVALEMKFSNVLKSIS